MIRLNIIGDFNVKTSHSQVAKTVSQSLGPEVAAEVKLILDSAHQAGLRRGRFQFYKVLRGIYCTYRRWRRLGDANRNALKVAELLNIPSRAVTSPIRILVDAAFPDSDLKQKSR